MTPLRMLLLVATALAACRPGAAEKAPERELEPAERAALVHLDTEHMHLRHDRVGHDKWASHATFVLVDVESRHGEDLFVTLGGELVDAAGQIVGHLRAESLRVPAGGVRTFALVDRENQARPAATDARVRVTGAYVPTHAPSVQITDGHVHQDGDRVVVSGMVRNAVDRPVRVLVIAGFYDREGTPLRRPFTEMYLLGDGRHPAEFVGPPGSVSGYIFVGDMVY